MDKDMASAKTPTLQHGQVGRLKGTGIKLVVTDQTGANVNYGVQLNNTTLEIEAISTLKVEVVGFKDMYEALKIADTVIHNAIRYEPAGEYRKQLQQYLIQIREAKAKADKGVT